MATTAVSLYRGYPLIGSAPVRAYITNKALTSNLATLTTAAVHGITQVGTVVTIQGVDSTFDGTYSIHSVPTTTSFTYVKTTTNVGSTAVSPSGTATFTGGAAAFTGFTISNKVVQNYVATLTTSSAHGLSITDLVSVTIGDTIYDGQQIQVIGVPSTTTFSYIVSTQTAASTAVTQGSFGKYPYLYQVPAATTAIATNILVSNTTTAPQTFSLIFAGVDVESNTTINPTSTAFFDIKQVLATGTNITGVASNIGVSFQISGVTIA
jgi:hypothetical protein